MHVRAYYRKFQFKMGLPKIIQIACHHVLSNQNALKFKRGAPLKQFFNTNLGIGIIKKTTFFVRIFDISPCVFTQISIGRARWMRNLILHPTSTHTAHFWQALLPQKQEIPKKHDHDVIVIITFFQVFLVFGVAGFTKSM